VYLLGRKQQTYQFSKGSYVIANLTELRANLSLIPSWAVDFFLSFSILVAGHEGP
jgi:hypothetical protein